VNISSTATNCEQQNLTQSEQNKHRSSSALLTFPRLKTKERSNKCFQDVLSMGDGSLLREVYIVYNTVYVYMCICVGLQG
jgi:hypothetical protein